ncbi:protein RETICULATA-RELATED 3, chloroplastic-like [Typha latifolia]|uniref:protein RETICULATA-RELATED 3, chloroplastic-like n=1 Tax=Typha latifolia TaxID=4733 RepID=UPI003C2EFE98
MAAQLRHVPPPNPAVKCRLLAGTLAPTSLSFPLLRSRSSNPSLSQTITSPDPLSGGGNGGITKPPFGSDGGGGGERWGSGEDPPPPSDPLGIFLEGWRSRVSADPEFPFKVLMEELVGVTSNVLGDMASRPNFGLGELDFVFSTLVVGSIVNFVLMYLLAPTSTSATSSLPGIFSSSPAAHMFETGSYSLLNRFGTFAYKGATFAAVGFAAGLAGTAISNGLIALRKKMDPGFETVNKSPPTVLNALTWALHMGISSNFRYQALNGIEFVMARGLPPAGFKGAVVVLRCLNNLLGGMSFVALARITGSQKAGQEKIVAVAEGEDEELQRSECK